jgi:hypothetical protein
VSGVEVFTLSEGERFEAHGLLVGLLADVDAGRVTAHPAVAAWIADVAAEVLPISDEELDRRLRAALTGFVRSHRRLTDRPPSSSTSEHQMP